MTDFVYVTGCDTGFGNIAAKMLDNKGLGVFAACYTDEAMEALKKEGSDRLVPVKLDVSQQASVDAAAERIRDELAARPGSKLMGLVNNAGILVTPGPVEFTPMESFRSMMDVNFFGTVMVTKSVLPLIRQSRGRIINVASVAGRIGLPTQPAYCPSKYAVEAFSDILRRDMLPWGVSVHIIEPGVFNKTGLYGNYQTGLDQLWDRLPESVRKEYGEEYKKFLRSVLGMALSRFGNSNSNLVPEAMVEALTSRQAKYRYRVGLDSKYLITFLSWLPEGLQDLILTHSDNSLPEVLPATAPQDGKKSLAKRYKGPNYKFIFALLAAWYIVRKLRS
mmetsp:Transcript_18792/g.59956  ORF Transcript_18792/g.59956 Transcript_18792/m.59956 type:complete len:334 (+) Transcript_18792:3-1004(+)